MNDPNPTIGAAGPTAAEQAPVFQLQRVYLKDAIITSVQLSAARENPSESVSFAFQAVEVAYRPEKDDGSLDGAVPKGYDLESLKPGFAAPSTLGG